MDTVNSAAMKAAVKDRRKKTFVRAGLVIKFKTDEQYTLDHYCRIAVDDETHSFRVFDVEIVDDNKLEVSAVESGYWAKMLGRKSDFDVRSIVGLDIEHITDDETIRGIKGAACLT